MRLTLKLVLAFMALASAALIVALVSTTVAVEKAAEDKISSDLSRTLEAFQQLARSTQVRIRDVAEAHSRDRTFRDMALSANSDDSDAGLGGADAELEGIDAAREIIRSADTEAFGWSSQGERIWAFVNARGRLVFTHGDARQVGMATDGVPLVGQVLASGPISALWSPAQLQSLPFTLVPAERIRQKDLLLVHAHPVLDVIGEPGAERRGRLLGVALSGRWVSDILLDNPLGGDAMGSTQGTRALFALRSADGGLATTLPPGTPLEDVSFSAPETSRVRIGSARYLVREDVFRDAAGMSLGRVFVLRNLDAEIEPILSPFRRWLLLTAGAVLLCALGVAVVLARRISSPLLKLEAAARQVRLGDLDVSLPVSGSDEVGRLTGAFNEMVAGLRQRDQIKGLFKRYLDPQVVEELLRHPEKAAPGGERRELSILFSDLAGFTSLSETMSPEQLVELLNGYFERATEVLTRHGATLDKFIGDAIMCFWNAPLPQEDHAVRACLTALELLSVVDALAPELEARGLARLDCRIGLHTGHAVVGNIGSRQAQDYTVIGDTVNLASRLEGAVKVYGTRTLVTEDTMAATRGEVLARELDWLRVKGRQQPVRVFELIGVAGSPRPPHLERFAEGLALYREGRFSEARVAFLASPEDPPSRVFSARCEALLASPPARGWDGVFTLDTK